MLKLSLPLAALRSRTVQTRLSFSRTMASRTYKDAIDTLNSLQSNAATLDAMRASGSRLSEFAIPEMIEYLGRIGYRPDDLNNLNVIHVTGTKGKGSTCAFVDSILRRTKPDWKIGLYTSPHLCAVRERIRINGAPIAEEDFAKYFFEVWDRLEANDVRKDPNTSPKPMYFRYMTLVAFHAFLDMKVDATILEVGIGGLHDSTNIVPKPIVTGVTSLGIDHVVVLGNTLADIAYQKGGIYKEGVPAFSVPQPEEGMQRLEQQARDRKASSFVVTPLLPEIQSITLGLAGKHQLSNANLAVNLAATFIASKDGTPVPDLKTGLPQTFVEGLERARWPGRCQRVVDPKQPSITWFLDGAHTKESLECCMEWFVSPDQAFDAAPNTLRVLIFNCTSGRSGKAFLSTMFKTVAAQLSSYPPQSAITDLFDRVIFSTNVTYADGHFKGDLTKVALTEAEILKTQRELAESFAELFPAFPAEQVIATPSIEHAIKSVHSLLAEGTEVQVLVCGSLHLVGGVIEVAGLSDVALSSA
ncbi:FolC bifunctional protein [Exidia glandulosa HHB12029]|uniref:Folylpolyglutamate synthase n=1 Tax=Exidia glandulosa HHB12029 TaxID=1314781 RepID=A0A165QVB7_EXIGL|nr:FolC bifunctional protein [Exidia glandulosa HHB12029]